MKMPPFYFYVFFFFSSSPSSTFFLLLLFCGWGLLIIVLRFRKPMGTFIPAVLLYTNTYVPLRLTIELKLMVTLNTRKYFLYGTDTWKCFISPKSFIIFTFFFFLQVDNYTFTSKMFKMFLRIYIYCFKSLN